MRSLATTIALGMATILGTGCHAFIPGKTAVSSRNYDAITSRTRYEKHHLSRSSTILTATAFPDAAPDPPISGSDQILTKSRLIYFGIPGRGEAIRLALRIGGVDFEDQRIPFPAWGKNKPTTPWGNLPVLELADGSRLGQSRSILRFVGKRTGLYPVDDDLVAQRVDELMDVLEDLGAAVMDIGRGLPKEELEEVRRTAAMKGGSVYDILQRIDAFIGTNGSGGHAVGADMTVADILAFTNLGRLVGGVYYGVPPEACDPFPNIQRVRKTVGSDPAVVAWYDTRKTALSPAELVLAGCRDL